VIDVLTIGIPVAVLAIGCVYIVRHKIPIGDVPLFREHTGRHTPEAVAAAQLRNLGDEPAEVPFTAEVEPSAALERAAALLPDDFDPKVDSLVGGIPPVREATP
jgi:hypothetical protein